jgi:DNA-binding transcriptional regulator YiaG
MKIRKLKPDEKVGVTHTAVLTPPPLPNEWRDGKGRILTEREVAKLMNVSVHTVRRWFESCRKLDLVTSRTKNLG